MEDSEIIHVVPALVPEHCCLLMFTLSSADLNHCDALAVTCYAKEKNKAKDAVVRSDEKAHLSSFPEPCRVALAVYRSGNGWLAYYPACGLPCPGATTWGDCIPHMKSIAAAIPQLEAHAAFDPAGPGSAHDLPIAVPEKARDCAIGGPAAGLGVAPAAVETTTWPAPPAGNVEASAVDAPEAPSRLRLDVGWALWDAEAEGSNILYQLVFTAANGDVVECGEEQGVTQGIALPPDCDDATADEDAAEPAPADEVHPLPSGQDTDPHGFPTKESFFIALDALPARVAAATLLVINFSGGGMANVRSLHARVSDASSGNPHTARDLFVYSLPHERGAHGSCGVAALVKLYREYSGSAFALLRDGVTPPLKGLIHDGAAVRGTLAALRDAYCAHLEAERIYATALEAEESGEEGVVKPVLPPRCWRVAALGLLDKADDAESYVETEGKRSALFEGPFNGAGRREGTPVRAVYRNLDCFIGKYVDDERHGEGVYVFANRGAYAGEYEHGMRCGAGVLLQPDGGCYTGSFANDKFEGYGSYEYPDGSCFVGEWSQGRKHGHGCYWEKRGGCMEGDWASGTLSGSAEYHQPAFHVSASYTKGIPDGLATFTAAAFRKLPFPGSHGAFREAAAVHIRAATGPVLTAHGTYALPPGAAADPPVDEDGNPVEDDGTPKMPAPPRYNGLAYKAAFVSPTAAGNMVYPPPQAQVPACITAEVFAMGRGVAA